jgi:hypothetical protein
MNFIEAWEKAKDNQVIRNKFGSHIVKRKTVIQHNGFDTATHAIADALVSNSDGRPGMRIFDSHILCDWEVIDMYAAPDVTKLEQEESAFSVRRIRMKSDEVGKK